jgi:O-antigen ligase
MIWGAVKSAKWSGGIEIPRLILMFLCILSVALLQGATGELGFESDLWMLALYVGLIIFGVFSGHTLVKMSIERESYSKSNKSLQSLALLMVLVSVLCTTQAFVQTLNIGDGSLWLLGQEAMRRPGGNLSQPNHLATILVLGIAAVFHLKNVHRLSSVVAICLILLICFALVVTESRTGLLSFLLVVAFNMLRRSQAASWVGLNLIVILLTILSFWYWPLVWNYLQINEISSGVSLTSSGRLDLWGQIIHAVSLRPIRGWGFGQTSFAQNAVASEYGGSLAVTYAHNIILDLCIWFGVPVAAALLAVATWWVFKQLSHGKGFDIAYLFGSLIPISIHSQLEFPFGYSYFLFPFSFFLGAISATNGLPVFRIRVYHLCILLFAWLCVGVWSVIEYVEIEEDFRVRRFDAANVGAVPVDYTPSSPIMLRQLGALLDVVNLRPHAGMSDDQIRSVGLVALKYPWPATLAKYVEVLALNDRRDEFKRQMKVLESYYGGGIIARVQLRIEAQVKQ